jgi:hypothetical protein
VANTTHRHRFISGTSLRLAVTAFSLERSVQSAEVEPTDRICVPVCICHTGKRQSPPVALPLQARRGDSFPSVPGLLASSLAMPFPTKQRHSKTYQKGSRKRTNLTRHDAESCYGQITGNDRLTERRVGFVLEIQVQGAHFIAIFGGIGFGIEYGSLDGGGSGEDLLRGYGRVRRRRSDGEKYARAPESLARASYTSSMHLSRVLSPRVSTLTPSDFAVRVVGPAGFAAAGGVNFLTSKRQSRLPLHMNVLTNRCFHSGFRTL